MREAHVEGSSDCKGFVTSAYICAHKIS